GAGRSGCGACRYDTVGITVSAWLKRGAGLRVAMSSSLALESDCPDRLVLVPVLALLALLALRLLRCVSVGGEALGATEQEQLGVAGVSRCLLAGQLRLLVEWLHEMCRDHDEQLGLLAAIRARPEQHAEDRQVAEQGNLVDRRANLVRDQ